MRFGLHTLHTLHFICVYFCTCIHLSLFRYYTYIYIHIIYVYIYIRIYSCMFFTEDLNLNIEYAVNPTHACYQTMHMHIYIYILQCPFSILCACAFTYRYNIYIYIYIYTYFSYIYTAFFICIHVAYTYTFTYTSTFTSTDTSTYIHLNIYMYLLFLGCYAFMHSLIQIYFFTFAHPSVAFKNFSWKGHWMLLNRFVVVFRDLRGRKDTLDAAHNDEENMMAISQHQKKDSTPAVDVGDFGAECSIALVGIFNCSTPKKNDGHYSRKYQKTLQVTWKIPNMFFSVDSTCIHWW